MLKHISKIKDGYYRIDLDGGSTTIHVTGKKSCEKIEKLIDGINEGFLLYGGSLCMRSDVLWMYFDIAKILRRYDTSTANAWCAAELGGMKNLVKFAIDLIGSQWYGEAGDLLNEIEEISYTMDKFPVVIGNVFEDEEAYEQACKEMEEAEEQNT
jgi:hypothetical protein